MALRRAVVFVLFMTGAALAGEVPLGFSGPLEGSLPAGWKHIEFPSIPSSTSYAVVSSGNVPVLHARASSSASFVIRRVPADFDVAETPLLRWRWRVDRTVPNGDGKSKDTDDFPARVWVGFEGDWSTASWRDRREADQIRERTGYTPPLYWIHYVWAGRGRSRGEPFDEPFSPARFKCIALRNILDDLGVWVDEARDPRADFKKLFGRDAPRIVAVAVMTDTDNSSAEAEAYYSEIAFVSS
jgi:hypothetical protein